MSKIAQKSRKLARIQKLMTIRDEAMARVNRINSEYEVKIQKILTARDLRSAHARSTISRINPIIKATMLTLTGSELGELNRTRPRL